MRTKLSRCCLLILVTVFVLGAAGCTPGYKPIEYASYQGQGSGAVLGKAKHFTSDIRLIPASSYGKAYCDEDISWKEVHPDFKKLILSAELDIKTMQFRFDGVAPGEYYLVGTVYGRRTKAKPVTVVGGYIPAGVSRGALARLGAPKQEKTRYRQRVNVSADGITNVNLPGENDHAIWRIWD